MLADRVRMGVSKDNGLILYDYGIENVPFVGWDIDGDKYPDYTEYEVSKYPNYLYLYTTSWSAPSPPIVGFSTSNKIDITPYTTIKIKWELVGLEGLDNEYFPSFGISNIQKAYRSTHYTKMFEGRDISQPALGVYEKALDLSDITGQYYIVVSSNYRNNVKIYSIILE